MVSSERESLALDATVVAAIRALGNPGEPDVFADVTRLFLADVPTRLSALSAAIAAGDVKSVLQIAHHLRGSALDIGAVRMAPVCEAIELDARTGSLTHAAERAENLESEFAAARAALEQVTQ
jgi:HPt (histidine-containing phosphotransfer) domain-containing protein